MKNEQGYYRITCTAHYTPIATGPFTEEREAFEWAREKRMDIGVFNPPPFTFGYFRSMNEAKRAAEALAAEYKADQSS